MNPTQRRLGANERRMLHEIRRHGSLAKAELAYASPDAGLIFPAIKQQLARMLATLGGDAAARNFGEWEELLRMPAADAAEWAAWPSASGCRR